VRVSSSGSFLLRRLDIWKQFCYASLFQETSPCVFTVFLSVEVARTVRQQDFIDFSPAVVDFQFQLLSLYAKHHQDVPGNLQLVSDRTLLTSALEAKKVDVNLEPKSKTTCFG